MNFIPEQPKQEPAIVPFFDDVTSEQGWRGHTTRKSFDKLKMEIVTSVQRLGGMVVGFQKGTYQIGQQKRDGFQIHYTVEQPNGVLSQGRLDVAALPVKDDYSRRRSYETRREKSLKMALYMLREALDGTWFLQHLSPGYAPLMPWMIEAQSGKTITQLWSESATFGNLLPPGDSEFIEAEFDEV